MPGLSVHAGEGLSEDAPTQVTPLVTGPVDPQHEAPSMRRGRRTDRAADTLSHGCRPQRAGVSPADRFRIPTDTDGAGALERPSAECAPLESQAPVTPDFTVPSAAPAKVPEFPQGPGLFSARSSGAWLWVVRRDSTALRALWRCGHPCPSGCRAIRTLQSVTVVQSPPARARSRTLASSRQPAHPSTGVGSNSAPRSGRSTGALGYRFGSVMRLSVRPKSI